MSKTEDEEKCLFTSSTNSPASAQVSSDSENGSASEESLGSAIPVAPDGGWGWVVVASAFLCFVIADGMLFTFGVLYVELIDYFDAGKGETALVGSVFMGMSMFCGPFTGALVNVWGIRPVALIGTIIASGSFACSVAAPTLKVLTFTYGFMGGLGICMIYLPTIIVVGFYFDKKRALANGITSSGSGLGAFIFSPLTNYLIRIYTWKGAMLILSGIVLNGLVLCALYRPLKSVQYVRKINTSNANENDTTVNEDKEQCKSNSNSELFKSDISSSSPHLFEGLNNSDKSQSVPDIETIPKDTTENHNLLKSLQMKRHIESHSSHYDMCNKFNEIPHSVSVTHGNMHSLGMSSEIPRKLHRSSGQIYASKTHQSPIIAVKHIHLKPLEKKDIFYSGSLERIPSYKSCNRKKDDDITAAEEDDVIRENSGKYSNWKKSILQVTGLRLLSNPIFLFIVAFSVMWTTHSTILTILPHYSVERGNSDIRAATLLSIIGIANTIARVFAGWLSNFERICCVWVNVVALITGGVTCILVPFTHSYVIMCIQAAVFGSCMATWTSLRPIVIVELLGISNLTNAFGLLAMFQGFAFIIGPPIAGKIYDVTGSYMLPFLLAGGAFITSGVVCIVMKKVFVYTQKKNQQKREQIK